MTLPDPEPDPEPSAPDAAPDAPPDAPPDAALPADPKLPRRARILLQSVLLLAVGVGILVALTSLFGTENVRETLLAGDLTLLGGALLLYLSQTLTMGLRWWAALRLLGHDVRLVSIVRANSGSNFINFFAPGHFGEPLASAWLGRSRRAAGVEAFTVLIACKAAATVVNLLVLVACLPFLAVGASMGSLAQIGVLAAVLSLAGVGAIVLLLAPQVATTGRRFVGWSVARLLGLFGSKPPLIEAARARTEAVFGRIHQTFGLFARSPSALAATSFLSVVKLASLVWAMALVYRAFGQDVSVFGSTFLETVDVLGNIVAIWIPANLGVQEAINTTAAVGGLDIDGPVAFSAAIATKVIVIVHVAFGGVVWWALRALDPAPPDEGDEALPAG